MKIKTVESRAFLQVPLEGLAHALGIGANPDHSETPLKADLKRSIDGKLFSAAVEYASVGFRNLIDKDTVPPWAIGFVYGDPNPSHACGVIEARVSYQRVSQFHSVSRPTLT